MRISDWSSDVCSSDRPFWALTGNGGYTRAASNVLQARPCLRNGDLKNAPVEYFRKQVRLGGCRRLQCPCRLFERGAACAAASARGGCHNGPAPEYQIGRASLRDKGCRYV